MSATGEGLGAGWEQERTHRTGEQKACRPTLAIDDSLHEGEHLGRTVELVDRHEPGRGQRGTDIFANEVEHGGVREGSPDQIPPLLETLETLAPLAVDVTIMSLRHSLQDAAETFVRGEARRLRVDIPRPRDPHSA